jgi:hypothetical protein
LLLDPSLFPPGTYAEKIMPPDSDDPAYSRSFDYGNDAVFQEVSLWSYPQAAKDQYNFLKKTTFEVGKDWGPWSIPPELSQLKLRADQYRIGCGIALHEYLCFMIATYQDYFVFFRSYISEHRITLPIVAKLVQAIDDRMMQCSSD